MTPLAMSALALLNERPMHPYEMYQTLIQRSEDRIVKVRPGSLYHTVNKLEELGLVRATGTEREGNRPERTTYEITEKGNLALAERIAGVIEAPEYEFPVFPVAISQAHNLPRETVVNLLERRLQQLESRRSEIGAGLRKLGLTDLPRKYWLDVDYLRSQYDAEHRWLERVVADIRSGELDWGEAKHAAHPGATSTSETKDDE
ncbi:MAG: PadR family transcriptional regulator [Microbacteriaceae bacterium]|nr:PadR family transcriptional regulator [Microbacteriaceae bacterium]MCL2793747.1 PadR family transcriptional regulator [Microbacteriaceae bacterium]